MDTAELLALRIVVHEVAAISRLAIDTHVSNSLFVKGMDREQIEALVRDVESDIRNRITINLKGN